MSAPDGPVLLCTDGSAAAEHAIERTAALLPGAPARVACAWCRASHHPPRTALGAAISLLETPEEVDARLAHAAREIADRGVEIARRHGLYAVSAAPAGEGLAAALMELADEVDARAIVLGQSQHRPGAEILLGSVSREVTRHAGRPVILVPEQT